MNKVTSSKDDLTIFIIYIFASAANIVLSDVNNIIYQ